MGNLTNVDLALSPQGEGNFLLASSNTSLTNGNSYSQTITTGAINKIVIIVSANQHGKLTLSSSFDGSNFSQKSYSYNKDEKMQFVFDVIATTTKVEFLNNSGNDQTSFNIQIGAIL